MRGVLLSLALAVGLALIAPQAAPASIVSAGSTMSASASHDFQNPPKDVTVDINVNRGGGHWYRSPVWIAIGAVAAVMILLLIIIAVRSGGSSTTIVKD
jgi:hypothetical protein